MSDIKRNYFNLHWQRRSELFNVIYSRTHGLVYQGPFKGMKILPKYKWGDGDTLSKLLGIYENEIYHCLEKEIKRQPKFVLNIGCAEGYYGLGMARCLPQSLSILVEIDKDGLSIARENAIENQINNVHFFDYSDIDVINLFLKKNQSTFIIMDVEGHELELLDNNKLSNLNQTSILVEVHDTDKIYKTLIQRFQNTHNIEIIKQGPKNPYIDILSDLDDYDKFNLICEGRGSTMYWFYITPK